MITMHDPAGLGETKGDRMRKLAAWVRWAAEHEGEQYVQVEAEDLVKLLLIAAAVADAQDAKAREGAD